MVICTFVYPQLLAPFGIKNIFVGSILNNTIFQDPLVDWRVVHKENGLVFPSKGNLHQFHSLKFVMHHYTTSKKNLSWKWTNIFKVL